MTSTRDLNEFVAGLTQGAGEQPQQLLQHLYQIQQRYSYIPPQAIEQLNRTLRIPAAQIGGVVDFYSFLHTSPRGRFYIQFSDNITDRLAGNLALMRRLCDALGVQPGRPRDDGRVTVDTTSCTGMCDQGPGMLVNSQAVTRVDAARVDQIAGLVEQDTPLDQWPQAFFDVQDNIHRRDLLLDNNTEPGDALRALQERGAEQLLGELENSGLRGRGGAGFTTALKWRLCREARGAEHYVVCNADEGEPGTFKDRVLLHSYPGLLFEGMALCAGIIGARRGYIYLRGEYLYLRPHLESVLQEYRQQGLLGEKLLGRQGFDFDIHIHMGAGAYICGEESALIESLEGKRGIPRKRPPFPVTSGYLNQPTVVNNVETLIAAAKIAALGADRFSSLGTEKSTGTKILSISGDCQRPGIYEYPMGTPVREVLADCGAPDPLAVQLAGAAGETLPASEFDRRITWEDAATGGSFMVLGKDRDLLEMTRNFAHFFVHESCGFCTPCRVGGSLLKDLVDKLCEGHATQYDLKEMREIGTLMRQASHCGLGATAPNPVLDALEKFPEVCNARLKTSDFQPAFDLDAALSEARELTGRDDAGAHVEERL